MHYRPEIFKEVALVASTIDLPINWELSNCFVALKYYDADPTAGAANEVTPGAGSVVITTKLVVHNQYVSIIDGTFDATLVTIFSSFVGNVSDVRAVPTGITTATHYELIVSQNRS